MKTKTIIIQATAALSAGMLFTACSSMRHERASYQTSDYSSAYDTAGQTSLQESSGAEAYQSSQKESSLQSSQGRDEVIIPLHEEQLNVGKRTVDAGQVTIRKIVKTETVSQPVQLRTETLVIDREGAGAQRNSSGSSSQSGSAEWQRGTASQSESGAGISASAQAGSTGASANLQGSAVNEPAGASASENRSSYSAKPTASSDLNSGPAFQEQTYTIHLQKEEPFIQKNIVQTGQVVARKSSQVQQQNVQQQIRKEDVQLDKSGVAAQNVEIRGDFSTAEKQISEPSGAERQQSIDNQSEKQRQPDSIENEPSGAQQPDAGVNESTDSTTHNRAPTQGQGAQDLKKQPEDVEP